MYTPLYAHTGMNFMYQCLRSKQCEGLISSPTYLTLCSTSVSHGLCMDNE